MTRPEASVMLCCVFLKQDSATRLPSWSCHVSAVSTPENSLIERRVCVCVLWNGLTLILPISSDPLSSEAPIFVFFLFQQHVLSKHLGFKHPRCRWHTLVSHCLLWRILEAHCGRGRRSNVALWFKQLCRCGRQSTVEDSLHLSFLSDWPLTFELKSQSH